MLKQLLTSILLIMSLTSSSQVSSDDSIHQFKVADISGNIFDFSELKGKKVMIVNTASKCGLTYQYESLQKLYSQYKDFNFVIIGFPSNDFLWQEPGSNEQIHGFL
jgi:glutathione peroxidase